jgi:hypothetical protein
MANKAVAGKCIFNVPIAFHVFLAKKAQWIFITKLQQWRSDVLHITTSSSGLV